MKNIWLSIILLATCLVSGCQKEEIVEPEVSKQQTQQTTFGEFMLEVKNITDRSAEIHWTGNPPEGRYDIYLDDELVGTGEVKYQMAFHTLSNLSPMGEYKVKVRWICSEDEVKFAEVAFTTKNSFALGLSTAVLLDKYSEYLYADYSYLTATPVADGTVYTLKTQKDFGLQNIWVTLMKAGEDANMQWVADYPLYVDEHYSEYRKTELLADGSLLLLTTKRIICTEANGKTRWMHEFIEPLDKKLFLNDVCMMDGGQMMVVGSSQRQWGQNDEVWEEAYVAVLSTDGKLLHETYHSIDKQTRLDRIEPMANGNYLAVGITGPELGLYDDGTFLTYRLDATGAVLEVEEFPDFLYQQATTSLKDNEGNIYFLGKETNPGIYVDSRISVVRLDSEGNFIARHSYAERAGEGFLVPVYMGLEDNERLVIVADDVRGTNVLVTDKQGNKVHHWGVVTYPSDQRFVYARTSGRYTVCLDNYGYFNVFDMSGYWEYPYTFLN